MESSRRVASNRFSVANDISTESRLTSENDECDPLVAFPLIVGFGVEHSCWDVPACSDSTADRSEVARSEIRNTKEENKKKKTRNCRIFLNLLTN